MPQRLQEYMIILDYVINNEGDLVHYSFYADTDPINVGEALNDSKWIHARVEELKSIEDDKI